MHALGLMTRASGAAADCALSSPRLRWEICEWLTTGSRDVLERETSGWLELSVGGACLTRNQDIWSHTVRERVLVSAYPLALWVAANWWRLLYEPLPASRQPSLDWRLAHELGAAGRGYVWPRIVFAAAGDEVQVWAVAMDAPGQSVRYLQGLAAPQAVPLSAFEHGIEAFVETVLARLSALGHEQTDLAELWRIVCADRADRTQASVRRIEARLGYDPEGCPPELLKNVVSIEQKIGEAAMAELAPVCGTEGRNDIDGLQRLATDAGVSISPEVPFVEVSSDVRPWQQGVLAARRVRERLAKPEECIKDRDLDALLGVVGPSWPDMVMQVDRPVSVVRPHTNDRGRGWVFIPRKRHRYGRRFEYARVLGDFATYAAQPNEWRPVTDLYTTRQKRQRAFAAELLCPIDGLRVFLDDDLSESAIDEASHHYQVSEQVVRMQLINAGLLPDFEPPPYVSGRDGVLPS